MPGQFSSPLLVIVPDRLSDLVAKGEITPGYYNPGHLFGEVHLLMTTDDQVDPAAVQPMVGEAKLSLHRLPIGRGWRLAALAGRPQLLRGWASAAVRLAERIRPALVRCHGNWWNGYLAVRIKECLEIPFVVSLHINPDVDVRRRVSGWKARLWTRALEPVERLVLQRADMVLPVYEAIVPYLARMGVDGRWTVIHNAVNVRAGCKDDYRLHRPIRLVSVGRQLPGKNPEAIIRALRLLPEAQLTLVGDGEYHARLCRAAAACGVADRVIVHRSLPNEVLCGRLPEFDLFVAHSDYWELSKAVLEALLAGLPVVLNRRQGPVAPELRNGLVKLTDGSPEGYAQALRHLIEHEAERERLGREAAAYARRHWAPEAMEAKTADIYRQLANTFRPDGSVV